MSPWLGVFSAKLKNLFAKRRPDSEFDEEMHEHLRLLTQRYMSTSDAASAARRQFGNQALLREGRTEMQSIPWIEIFWRDIRYGIRQLRLNPLFTAGTVLSLALGIGANVAIFTLLDQLILRLLPVHDQRGTERISAELVSGNYFQALGIDSAIGRVFSSKADDRIYKGHPSVVLSYQYWTRRFAGDPRVVGETVLINDYPMEIVGVSAAGFVGLDPVRSPDIRIPILMAPMVIPGRDDLANRRSQWVQIFARLKPGYKVESARASLQPLFHQILLEEAGEPALSRLSQYDRNRF